MTARTAATSSDIQGTPRRPAGKALWILTILTVAAFAVKTAVTPLTSSGIEVPAVLSAVSGIAMVLLIVFVFWHGARRYGAAGILTFFVITMIISNIFENLSISTGFPFGHYHYADQGVPFLFQVPISIGPAYFAWGYLSWVIALTILGRGDERTRTVGGTIALPIVSAFVMVMWDVVMDPLNSTVSGMWIWHDGGGYNGVPLSNYLGWFLTVWLIYQAFALVLHVRPALVRAQEALGFWSMPVLLYGVTALSYVLGVAFIRDATVTDATGRQWSIAMLWETASIIGLFTMVFVTVLAGMALLRRRQEERTSA